MTPFIITGQVNSANVEKSDSQISLSRWLKDNVKVGQSMETIDQRGEPAQFQLTIPQSGITSYLINLGISVSINPLNSSKFISKVKSEFHQNTLIDKKQNNFEIGYQGTWNFKKVDNTRYFVTFDPKYVYDGEKIKNSVASNFLFSWFKKKSKIVNWNTNTYSKNKKQFMFLSFFAGFQFQDILNAQTDSEIGYIMRPLYSSVTAFGFNKLDTLGFPYTKLKLSLNYTGRYDVINTTAQRENYSQLFKASVDWFLTDNPFKVSVGTSFNYGSDPLKGLLQQQFWLFTINIQK